MRENNFKHLLLDTKEFVVTCEHIPGRVSQDKKLDEILDFAAKCKESGIVHAISLTDNPGGTPAISPDYLAMEIEKIGIPAIVHFTSKDMNRNMVESRALALDRMDVKNLLVMSGDYQTIGQAGLSMPVFDADPVHILTMLTLMNKGWHIKPDDRTLEAGPKTDFFHGAVVSPFKFSEAETMMQYYKMEKKARAGAQYFITQLGFDSRKLRDLMNYMKQAEIKTPVFGSVFILRKGAATVMNKGEIPGSYVSDELLKEISKEAEAADKGRKGSLERAAKQVAVLKGLGFRGAHIEAMVLKFDMVEEILARSEELKPKWEEVAEEINYSPKGSFYLGAKTAKPAKLALCWQYLMMRVLHDLFFVKKGSLSPLMRGFCHIIEKSKLLGALVHLNEHLAKELMFGCQDCGDCGLPELHFLCPQARCPKQQRNGPCGGSRLDTCEVYPDRQCIWVKTYTRAKAFNEHTEFRKTIIGPRDWKLFKTSGWVNFHLNKDHTCYEFPEFFDAKEREETPKA